MMHCLKHSRIRNTRVGLEVWGSTWASKMSSANQNLEESMKRSKHWCLRQCVHNTACELVIWSGTVSVTVAKGLVHPRPTHVDHDQLGLENALVQVNLVMPGWMHIPLPVLSEQMHTLDDTRMSSIP